jgi:hypothetical protein
MTPKAPTGPGPRSIVACAVASIMLLLHCRTSPAEEEGGPSLCEGGRALGAGTNNAACQAGEWTHQFGTVGSDGVTGAVADAAGNVYAVGYTSGELPGQVSWGPIDAFVRKYDPAGAELWTRQFGTPGKDYAYGVSVDSHGGVYVSGATSDAHSDVFRAFVRKFDASGTELGYRLDFGIGKGDVAEGATVVALGISVDSDANVYVAGYTNGTLPGQVRAHADNYESFLRKYDATGAEEWTHQFGSGGGDIPYGVAVASSGQVYVAGFVGGALPGQASNGGSDAFMRAYSPSGSELWTRQFGTSGGDVIVGLGVHGDDAVYLAGYTYETLPEQVSAGGSDAFVSKYDASGNEQWSRQFGTGGADKAYSLSVGRAGEVYVAGQTNGALPNQENAGGRDAFVRKYDAAGVERWTLQFGSAADDAAQGIAAAPGDYVYVVGATQGSLPGQHSFGDNDGFVMRLDAKAP